MSTKHSLSFRSRQVSRIKLTWGFTSTRSINSTTKSCSTYLSAKRLHRGHCVSLTSPTVVGLIFVSEILGALAFVFCEFETFARLGIDGFGVGAVLL